MFIPVGIVFFALLITLSALTGGNPIHGLSVLFSLYFIIIPIFYIVKTIFFCMPSKIKNKKHVGSIRNFDYYDEED